MSSLRVFNDPLQSMLTSLLQRATAWAASAQAALLHVSFVSFLTLCRIVDMCIFRQSCVSTQTHAPSILSSSHPLLLSSSVVQAWRDTEAPVNVEALRELMQTKQHIPVTLQLERRLQVRRKEGALP